MKLTVRHLTGSRAGEEQIFESDEVTIGRNPSSAIMFDPEKDLVVSGKHALLAFDQNRWVVRDLGSSNGTFVDGSKITERSLHPGEIVQFGKNGPKVQLFFETQDDVAATVVEPLHDMSAPPPAREGRTLIMMMPQEGGASGAPAGPLPSYLAPARKKKSKILLIVAAAFMLLLVGVVALALLVRSSNVKKRKQLAAKKAVAVTSTVDLQKEKEEADRLNAEIAKKQEDIARTQQTLEQTPGGSSTSESEDMKRQLAESQALLEQMTRQLQEKNDQIAGAQSRPSAGQRSQPPFVPPASTPKKTTTQPSKVLIAQTVQGPGTTKGTPSFTPPVVATIAPPAAPLFTGKKLKKRVLITSLPPEIPPANLPSSTARDLVNLLNTALVSTGDYVVGAKGQASVSVMVTNYRADEKKSLDTKKTAKSAKTLGKLLGQDIPSNPVDIRSVAYDAAMSVRIRLYDPTGRLITEVEPSAQSSDRKSKVGLSGVSFHDVALSDTAVGDVARKVIGDTIDTLRNGLAGLEWSTTISAQSKEKLKLAVGRNANVEPGDVFEIMDGKKAVARARVINVSETGSEAEFITPLQLKLSGKPARYIGSENQSSGLRERFVTVRINTAAFDGPGTSFRELRPLKIGTRLRFQYSVGPWARVTHGGSTFWVPMAKVQITS